MPARHPDVVAATASKRTDSTNSNDSGIMSDVVVVDVDPDEPVFADLCNSLPPTPDGRVLYVSRHGESVYNLDNRIGGNPDLSPRGRKYAKALGEHIRALDIPGLKVWTSELVRTHQTSAHVSPSAPRRSHPELNELDSGLRDDLTYAEFESAHPEEFADREANKLTFRYPGGESYVDLCRRLERILPALDREHNLLLISHQAVIRCVLAFLLGTPGKDVPYIKVPLHCVLKITFTDGENRIEYHHLPVECVDTYRPRTSAAAADAKKEDEAAASSADPAKASSANVIKNLIGGHQRQPQQKRLVC